MRQLTELTTLLINLDLVAAENIEGFADEPKIIPSGKIVTINTVLNEPGIVLYRQSYTGTFFIDDYPFNAHPITELFGHICAYLLDSGNGSDAIPEPVITVDILDNGTANIEVSIAFEQDIYAVEDSSGSIPLNGKHYRIADPVTDYVLDGDISL